LFDSPDAVGATITGSDAALRASVGIGILWKSPLGPVRFDLAEAILKESYDKTELFRFSIGTRF
jgi:outer membrane protein insertion porin family